MAPRTVLVVLLLASWFGPWERAAAYYSVLLPVTITEGFLDRSVPVPSRGIGDIRGFVGVPDTPAYDLLDLDPIVEGRRWVYSGTLERSGGDADGRVTVGATMTVEIPEARIFGTGTERVVEYTRRIRIEADSPPTFHWERGIWLPAEGNHEVMEMFVRGRISKAGDEVLEIFGSTTSGTAPPVPFARQYAQPILIRPRFLRGESYYGLNGQSTSTTGVAAGTMTTSSELVSWGESTSRAMGHDFEVITTSHHSCEGTIMEDVSYVFSMTSMAHGVGPVRHYSSHHASGFHIQTEFTLTSTNFPVAPAPLVGGPHLFVEPEPVIVAEGEAIVLDVAFGPYFPPWSTIGANWSTPHGMRETFDAGGDGYYTIPSATLADAGAYQASFAGVTSRSIEVGVVPAALPGRFANFSLRAKAGAGERSPILGFVLQSDREVPGAMRRVVVRAIGAGLTTFGIRDPASTAGFTLHDGTGAVVLEGRDGLLPPAGAAADAAAVGAFALNPSDGDQQWVIELPAGAYTVVWRGAADGGLCLLEVYAVDPTGPGPKLVNLSGRSWSTGDDGDAIAGMVTTDGTTRTLLQARGQSLASFGVAQPLRDPRIDLWAGGRIVAGNDDAGRRASAIAR